MATLMKYCLNKPFMVMWYTVFWVQDVGLDWFYAYDLEAICYF